MLRIRKILLTISLLAGFGSLGGSLSYAWYLHSRTYRQALADRVSRYLDLPVTFGRVAPLSWQAIALEQVEATLHGLEDGVFHCDKAVWRVDRSSGQERRRLELHDGFINIGSAQSVKADYRHLLKSGLGHDFSQVGLEEVSLTNIDVRISRPSWQLRVDRAGGRIFFPRDSAEARAQLQSNTLNGYPLQEPLDLSARFVPSPDLILREVRLQVPKMPIAFLNLDSALPAPLGSGDFSGRIVYHENSDRSIEIHGAVEGLSLSELAFLGSDADVAGGCVDLVVDEARLHGSSITHLEASGAIMGVDLDEWAGSLGLGRMTGRLDVALEHLLVIDDRVVFADLTVTVHPPGEAASTIDRSLVQFATERALGMTLWELPFDELEYVHCGARLILQDQQLRVEGLYGPDRKTILSIRLFGQEVALIRAPEKTSPAPDLLDLMQRRLGG